MTFHVERIDHVVLRVRDLPGMVRFYEQALGFKVERTLERINLVQMRAGASMLDLVLGDHQLGAQHPVLLAKRLNLRLEARRT